jgi:DNA primase catalytic core
MKLPQSFIEELKNRISVSSLVGNYVSLRKSGREYQALCPFHREKSPSFSINDEKGFYHCFGCLAHGDQIGFLMAHEHLGYMDAVEKLADMAGMQVPKPSKQAVAQEAKQAQLRDVLLACAQWYTQELQLSDEAAFVRHYLQERGLKPETIRQFKLGYAPADRQALVVAMEKLGITKTQLVESGMLIAIEDKAPYSRFRRRLMFPIHHVKGKVIAFGGRVLPGEANPKAAKYLNSPETALFHKGAQLYNLNNARAAALKADALVIAEGYMDVIAMAQAGITHAVAPLGTAITEEQLARCWQLVDAPILCLDGDNAGQRAMQRAIDLALPKLTPGKSLQIARLPQGEDPDSLLQNAGRAAFDVLLNRASALVDVIWQQAFDTPASTPEARAAQEQSLMRRIEQIADSKIKHYYREDMQERLRSNHQKFDRPRFNSAKRTKFNQPPFAKVALPQIPAVSHDGEQDIAQPTTKLLALVLWYPPILKEGDIENNWLDMALSANWQAGIHAALLDMAHAPIAQEAVQNRVVALKQIADIAAVQRVVRALEALGLPNNADQATRHLVAHKLWPELMNDLQYARLKSDIHITQMALARQMNEDEFKRLSLLQRQLEALQRERSAYYNADPLLGEAH